MKDILRSGNPETSPPPEPAIPGKGPGVPVTVWEGIPAPADGEGPLAAGAAARIIDAYTRHAGIVAVPSGKASLTVTQAAVRSGRCPLTVDLEDPAVWQPPLAALAVAAWAGRDASGVAVFGACQRALRPGGILAVLACSPGRVFTDVPGQAVAAARAAGLTYAQHVVLVHAAIEGDRFRPVTGRPGDRVHSDLIILAKSGGAPRHA